MELTPPSHYLTILNKTQQYPTFARLYLTVPLPYITLHSVTLTIQYLPNFTLLHKNSTMTLYTDFTPIFYSHCLAYLTVTWPYHTLPYTNSTLKHSRTPPYPPRPQRTNTLIKLCLTLPCITATIPHYAEPILYFATLYHRIQNPICVLKIVT